MYPTWDDVMAKWLEVKHALEVLATHKPLVLISLNHIFQGYFTDEFSVVAYNMFTSIREYFEQNPQAFVTFEQEYGPAALQQLETTLAEDKAPEAAHTDVAMQGSLPTTNTFLTAGVMLLVLNAAVNIALRAAGSGKC